MEDKTKGKFVFDPNHSMSYGYWSCPVCQSKFCWGGKALHETSCPTDKTYAPCVYHFGPKEAQEILERGSGALSPRGLDETVVREAMAQSQKKENPSSTFKQ
ncbi:MAG: hypothetical protein KKB21_01360 [Nanoarchaeota archaeon]|nr:hypothetical protein [Nanoarchaeota archaeon]